MSEKLQPQMARRASPNKSKTPAQRKRDQRRREAALAAAHMMRLRVCIPESLADYLRATGFMSPAAEDDPPRAALSNCSFG
jgi:hypothetical protein